MQNTGTTYEDDTMCVLTAWGALPHLMRNGRAKVALSLKAGDFDVFALDGDGTRGRKVKCAFKEGKLLFVADVKGDTEAASYIYEIVRR